MAAIAAFPADRVLGAGLVGLCGGFDWNLLRDRRYTTVVFNAGMLFVAATTAALAYSAATPISRPIAFAACVAGYALVNVALVTPSVSLNWKQSPRSVLRDVAPAMPNYLAFGLLGLVVGDLYRSLHPVVLPLLIIPAAIARKTFSSFLELKAAHESTISVFIRAIEAKDPYTAGHAERVAKYAGYMGEELAFTPKRQEHLRYAALMHDIGKLAVPSKLLNKPGRLTAEEYERVQKHNNVCIDILTRVDFMKTMVVAASDKHAHFREGHQQDQLVLEAHIIAVADAFDAMTSTRAYRQALSQDVAFGELRDKAGTQFNPHCVDALIQAIERRGEHYGLGYETDRVEFEVAPPVTGVGSAGLGDLDAETQTA